MITIRSRRRNPDIRHRNAFHLHNESATEVQRVGIYLAGGPGSGRSALATRFRDIDEGPYPETFLPDRRDLYTIPIKMNRLQNVQNVKKHGRVVLSIRMEPDYIGLYPIWIYAPTINLFVFCFDVNKEEAFKKTENRIQFYSIILRQNFPFRFVLGNKIDARDDRRRLGNDNTVSTEFAREKTRQWGVSHYMECSAWENRGVDRLLDFILTYIP